MYVEKQACIFTTTRSWTRIKPKKCDYIGMTRKSTERQQTRRLKPE
jgi:hypothetical protein